MVVLIIDIQYYPVNKKHELKEATILPLSNEFYTHFVFLNTCGFDEITVNVQKTMRYINKKLGVIHYKCGMDLLQDFLDHIPCEALLIVNGHVKKTILKSLLPQNRIVDLKIPFYSLTNTRMCNFPSFHTQCSLKNCYKIKNVFLCYFESYKSQS